LHKPKLSWRHPFTLELPDTLDFLAEQNMERYRIQRRLIGPAYRAANLKKYEAVVDAVLERVVEQLKSLNEEEVDLKEWMHIIAVECLGAVVLGWSPGYLRGRSDFGSGAHSYLAWRRKSVLGLFPLVAILESHSKLLGRLFTRIWDLRYHLPAGFKPFFPVGPLPLGGSGCCISRERAANMTAAQGVNQRVNRRVGAAMRPQFSQDQRNDLLSELIQLHKTKPEFTAVYLRRLGVTNFGAGHETTCSALTSAIAMIGSHTKVQARAIREARCRPADSILSRDGAVEMSYIGACIKEAQRLYPAIGMSLTRRVPTRSESLYLHGYHIPQGTGVGCNPVALHRNPDIFGHDADEFNPERWLSADDKTRRSMERYNLTWGGGARTCPGRHLAELIIHRAVPTLLREFTIDITLPSEDNICYYFMAMLTGVKARFRPNRQADRTSKDMQP